MRGNNDGKNFVVHFLDSPILLDGALTTRLSIVPETWNDKACVRFELIACGKFFI